MNQDKPVEPVLCLLSTSVSTLDKQFHLINRYVAVCWIRGKATKHRKVDFRNPTITPPSFFPYGSINLKKIQLLRDSVPLRHLGTIIALGIVVFWCLERLNWLISNLALPCEKHFKRLELKCVLDSILCDRDSREKEKLFYFHFEKD